ncbi:helix-turn-helix domain-containing protein [Thalassovita mangrovi]|nr:helix-turn-helix domain-containing protein [Thalassovita mangrovi]
MKRDSFDLHACDYSDARGERVSMTSPHGIRFTLVSAGAQDILLDYRKGAAAIWLGLVLEGELHSAEGGDVYGPGALLYGGEKTVLHATFPGSHKLLLALVPTALMRRRLPADLPGQPGLLTRDSAPAILLADLLKSVAANLPEASQDMLSPVEMVLPEFILAAVLENAEAKSLGGAAGRRASMLDRVRQAIEMRLEDPDLRLSDVADQFGVSQRYIQKLFETTGDSFGSYVKDRRLEHCRADMSNPNFADKTISDILFHWGFNDSPSFSRAFRARYGVTPRDFRRSAHLPTPCEQRNCSN